MTRVSSTASGRAAVFLMHWKHRYAVLAVLCGTYVLCYLDRMVMAAAIPFIAVDFHLSPLQMGAVMSAFFVGYAVMQIPGGVLADRFGPRAILALSIGWFTLMTAATGLATGWVTMIAIRVLFGLGEGPYPAAAAKAAAAWFPRLELGRANGVLYAAMGLGAAVAPLFVVTAVGAWGWRSVFYLLFIPGLAFAFLAWRYIRNSPLESSHISTRELADYEALLSEHTPIWQSLRDALANPAVRWCAVTLFFANVVNWGLLNWLPTYLLQARGFDSRQMGVFAGITNFAAMVGSILGGWLCDRYFKAQLRWPMIAGLLGSAAFTYFGAMVTSRECAVFYLASGLLIFNIAGTAIFTLPVVAVTQSAVGAAFGVVNTAGQIAGVLSPLIIGAILDATRSNFERMLYSLVALTFVAVIPAFRIRQPVLVKTG